MLLLFLQVFKHGIHLLLMAYFFKEDMNIISVLSYLLSSLWYASYCIVLEMEAINYLYLFLYLYALLPEEQNRISDFMLMLSVHNSWPSYLRHYWADATPNNVDCRWHAGSHIDVLEGGGSDTHTVTDLESAACQLDAGEKCRLQGWFQGNTPQPHRGAASLFKSHLKRQLICPARKWTAW